MTASFAGWFHVYYGIEGFKQDSVVPPGCADDDACAAPKRFTSHGRAFLTLFRATLGDPNFDELPLGALVMEVIFLFLAAVTILNLIVAVICNAFEEVRAEAREAASQLSLEEMKLRA